MAADFLDPWLAKLGPWALARDGVEKVTGWSPAWGRLWHRWAAPGARAGDDLGTPPFAGNPMHWLPKAFARRPVCGSETGLTTIDFDFVVKAPNGCARCIEIGLPMLLQYTSNTR